MQLGVPRRPGEGTVGGRPRALLSVRRRHHRRGWRSSRGRVRASAGGDARVGRRSAAEPRTEFCADAGTDISVSRSAEAGANALGTATRYADSGGGTADRSDTVPDAGFAAGDAAASARRKPAALGTARCTAGTSADSVGTVLTAGGLCGARARDPPGVIGTASGSTAVRGTSGHSASASGAPAVRRDARAAGGRSRWRAASRCETGAEHAAATGDANRPGPTRNALSAAAECGAWWVAAYADAGADQSVSRQRPEREGSATGARARVRFGDVLPAAA
jgi:hypothetical protein